MHIYFAVKCLFLSKLSVALSMLGTNAHGFMIK